ncbi:N-formylglutamate amidohydrolase superfamily [Polymorphum gilvum SL003B-26A1]|uniref:N-formylglutamate amidohydrolase superfamily n=1 Tax=Polymorphum gilvum (strain LMG 25793 / CGMCC 1.9160 / SL003B-26A1) TaxID=991905 RepID=F2J130_POLGS|nr:N-formylglutamate amidohydrolase superfamily [Polymorphum gilvum SL003B-26A1]
MVENRGGRSPIVLLCDHASNHIPAELDDLGLSGPSLTAHIAWDPGGLGVSRDLSRLLDAPLVHPCVSRLVIDCNRALTARDLIPEVSETTIIPGNAGLSPDERQRRIDLVHRPFHDTIERLLAERAAAGLASVLVSVHSFTPVYKGIERPWEIGILSNHDRRYAEAILADLSTQSDCTVGDNEPYSPADGVYYTLARHGEDNGLACAMIEIRNDEIADAAGERAWAERLAPILTRALGAIGAAPCKAAPARSGGHA